MSFAGPLVESITAAIIIILVLGVFFFIIGLLLKTYPGKSFGNWIEQTLFKQITFFQTLKGVTRQITGVENGLYTVVEVDLYDNNTHFPGLQTDTLNDSRYDSIWSSCTLWSGPHSG
jgi:hypothetical protein